MKQKKKYSLTIGIPAHNEEKNIVYMLRSVLKQRSNLYSLDKILVVCDGCTDKTAEKVGKLAKRYKKIIVVNDGKRTGKSTRLNQIYSLNKSDFLITFDADLVLERENEVERMVREIIKDNRINVVAANQIPVPASNLFGEFSNLSFLLFYEAAKHFNQGKNIYLVQGSASLLRRRFARKVTYPSDITCDQGYLYMIATKYNRYGFQFAYDTKILFRSISTFKDWRILGMRTLYYDKEGLIKHFGKKVMKKYSLPKSLIIKSIFYHLFQDPIATLGAIVMNMYIRRFPYKRTFSQNGTWEIISSSKLAIHMSHSL